MDGLFDETPAPPAGPGLFDQPEPGEPARQHAQPYRVLARAYRPTRFEDLIGQDAMVRTLRNAFALNRIAHAFMLTGVRGVGKTTTARIIARCLNCVGPDGTGGPTADPCGACANCRAILADRHPDVVEMDAASRTGVDDVREIIEATRFRPMQARTKVFIVDEVHMLSKNAFNALLKTLEEPPPHVKFIFATTELRKVPVTVLSRCQRFDLRRVSVVALAAWFARIAAAEQVAIAPAALDLIARAADGSVRDGLSLLDQAIAHSEQADITAPMLAAMLGLADRALVFDLLAAVMAGDVGAALAITDRAYADGVDFAALLGDLLELVHTLTRLQAVPSLATGGELPEAERVRGAALAVRLSLPDLARAWQMLLKGLGEVETATDRRAAAEMVLIRLCYVAELPTPGELVRQLRDAPVAARPASASAAPSAPSGPAGPGEGGGGRAMTNDGVVALAGPQPAAVPVFTDLRMIAAAAASDRGLAELHAHLVHSVHLVRISPGVLVIRPEPDAPRTLAGQLAALLLERTGQRWTIAISTEPGEPTLAAQGEAAADQRQAAVRRHPLVRAIMAAFPGATVQPVRDSRLDAYGLPAQPLAGVAEAITEAGEWDPAMPEFAPPEAEPGAAEPGFDHPIHAPHAGDTRR